MLISLNWIKDFVDLSGLNEDEIIKKFTLSCAEVEEITYKGKNISGIVTAKILSVENHPNSKKLHILKVKCDEELQIVCGAPNVRVGMIVPLAKIGAQIDGVVIAKASLGGVDSYGMCCSAKECGFSLDNAGLFEFEQDTKIGVDIKSILPIEDIIFEVDNKSLTNRPDLWGHFGIAREIAAITNRKLKTLPIYDGLYGNNLLKVKNNSKYCYRYSSVVIENISKKESSISMQIRLFYVGMRTINLMADLTNYVMLELGQPMHAFDNDIVKEIEVCDLNIATEFKTLDNELRKLALDNCVIKDENKIVALAGIMGGQNSEITPKTSNVLIESACFDGVKIRKSATALGMRTEASARYEKSLDPELTIIALNRLIYLLKDIDKQCIITSKLVDIYSYHYQKKVIEITKEFIDKYTGINISMDRICNILRSLEFKVEVNGEKILVSVPTFRATKDISCRADLVEEITRVCGYDNILPIPPIQEITPNVQSYEIDTEYNIKLMLAEKYNFNEIHSYIWYDSELNKTLGINPKCHIKVINSIQKDNDGIRSTLIPTMLGVVRDNKNNYDNIKAFEIGHAVVGLNEDGTVNENKLLTLINYNVNNQLSEMKNIIDYMANYVLNLDFAYHIDKPDEDYISYKNFYKIYANNICIGFIGNINPKVTNNISSKNIITIAEINITKLTKMKGEATHFKKVSKFPETTMDFSFKVKKEILYKDILKIANEIKRDFMYTISLVDNFEIDNFEKSITIRYTLINLDRTFIKSELDEFHQEVIDIFAKNKIELKM